MSIAIHNARHSDASDIAALMRASMSSHPWMPVLHSPGEDRRFIESQIAGGRVLAAKLGASAIGFISIRDNWLNQLYVRPGMWGRGIGAVLLNTATARMPEVRLHCFQENHGARRFYERHGFEAVSFGDGADNEERLPDVLYVRKLSAPLEAA